MQLIIEYGRRFSGFVYNAGASHTTRNTQHAACMLDNPLTLVLVRSPGHSAILERSIARYPLSHAMYRHLMVLVTSIESPSALSRTPGLCSPLVPCLWNLVVGHSVDDALRLTALEEWGVVMRASDANKAAFRQHGCVFMWLRVCGWLCMRCCAMRGCLYCLTFASSTAAACGLSGWCSLHSRRPLPT